jgi:TPR repeat protein
MRLAPVVLVAFCLLCGDAMASGARGPSVELKAGIAAYNAGDFSKAATQLAIAADRGEAEAMVNLGYLYARGHGVKADPALALQLYRRAAEMGDAEGMNAVGYRLNYATPPDFTGAAHWYCMAVLSGNQRAMNNLALLFYAGRGVPENREEAKDLWRQAMERGSLNAQTNLGSDLAEDKSATVAEQHEGMKLLMDAARQGTAQAQAALRHLGYTEAYTQTFDGTLPMHLESRSPKPGHSTACKDFLVS